MVMRRKNLSGLPEWERDNLWVVEEMQPIAVRLFYQKYWPDCEIISLDNDRMDSLKRALDVGGSDKMIKHPSGTISFLGQRFRKWDCRRFDDFTLRYDRPHSKYKTECEKILIAFKENCMLAGYYAYGHVNEKGDGFLRFRIIDFRKFVEKWVKGELPKSKIIPTRDGTATFISWPFSLLPKDLILYEYNDPEIPEDMEEDKPSNALERWI